MNCVLCVSYGPFLSFTNAETHGVMEIDGYQIDQAENKAYTYLALSPSMIRQEDNKNRFFFFFFFVLYSDRLRSNSTVGSFLGAGQTNLIVRDFFVVETIDGNTF